MCRPDLTWEDVIENAKTKLPFSQSIPARFRTLLGTFLLFAEKRIRQDFSDDHTSRGLLFTAIGEKTQEAEYTAEPHKKKAKQSSSKPVCMYGAKCFRKNAKHLADYSHPGREEDNEEKEEVKVDESQSTQEMDPMTYQIDDEKTADGSDDLDATQEMDKEEFSSNWTGEIDFTAAVVEEEDDEVQEKEEQKEPAGHQLPPCKYGAKCYRTNPDHLRQFYHPPKDK